MFSQKNAATMPTENPSNTWSIEETPERKSATKILLQIKKATAYKHLEVVVTF
jgi:hypothetical protein